MLKNFGLGVFFLLAWDAKYLNASLPQPLLQQETITDTALLENIQSTFVIECKKKKKKNDNPEKLQNCCIVKVHRQRNEIEFSDKKKRLVRTGV